MLMCAVVVCDTAKVRVFKQITTERIPLEARRRLFAILQKYEFSSKSQRRWWQLPFLSVVCDTAKVRVFKQITTTPTTMSSSNSCLRYCKSTSFQANHNSFYSLSKYSNVVCDTAKVRVFKQITTTFLCPKYQTSLFAILQKYEFSSKSQHATNIRFFFTLFAILQKYEFSSKSQQAWHFTSTFSRCLRYCKSTSFQANHNTKTIKHNTILVVCDTAKVRVFKQITTYEKKERRMYSCLRYCKSTSFQANHNSRAWVLP